MTPWALNLDALLQRSKLSQAKFGAYLGQGQTSISDWRTGTRDPTITNALQIALRTGYTLDQLIALGELGEPQLEPDPKAIGWSSCRYADGLQAALRVTKRSAKAAADAAGLRHPTVYRWLSYQREPKLGALSVLCAELGVSVHHVALGRVVLLKPTDKR